MALAAATIWEVETGGDDTNNGGAFDPSRSAGMFTDGAASNATGATPTFSSVSYSFVAGDVNAWLFIASGSNWTPGWYKITAVNAGTGVATLDAAIGDGVVATFGTITSAGCQLGPSTVVGCATVASPTGATWSIDYSQQAGSQVTYTDISSTGAGLTASSSAHPFGKQQVGNFIVVTGGTNFTAARYCLSSVAAGVGTFLGAANLHTGAGTDSNGAGRMGGALASPGKSGAALVLSNRIYVQKGTYTVTSTTSNAAAGVFAPSASTIYMAGYDTYRGDITNIATAGSKTRPTIIAGTITTFSLLLPTGIVRDLILDGNSKTASKGFNAAGNTVVAINIHAQNCTAGGIIDNSTISLSTYIRCTATGCTGSAAFATTGSCIDCEAWSNSAGGFNGSSSTWIRCLSYNNTGNGFSGSTGCVADSCVAYSNTTGFNGFSFTFLCRNCIAEGNTTNYNLAAVIQYCAYFNGSNVVSASPFTIDNLIALSSSPFVAPGSANFALNNDAGGGALLRALGIVGAMPRGLSTGYLDIGAVQHQEVSSGGAAVAIFGG